MNLFTRIFNLFRRNKITDESDTNNDEYFDTLRTQLTEKENQIKKLKKEVEDLEERAEEAEDDTKNVKKRLEGVKKEQNELKNSYRDIENLYTVKKQELEALAVKSEKLKNDLDEKSQSLGFVSEVLAAPDADDRDALDIREKTQTMVDFVQNDVCEVFLQTKTFSMGDLDEIQEYIWQWSNLQKKTWLSNKRVIAFVGEFSSGKTSIVNRIFTQDSGDEKLKLRVSSAPTTAIATYISYAQEDYIRFTDPNGDLKNMNMKTFLQFSKSRLENLNVSKLVRHFVRGYDNEHLKSLSILDTPGFSSNDKEDERRTVDVIKEADALFWVVDAHTGDINQHSVDVIKKHMKDTPLYIIINKVDDKSPNEQNQILNKVKQTMDKNGIQVKDFILFSTTAPLYSLMAVISGITSKREEKDIISDIKKFAENLIKIYEAAIKKERDDLRKYLLDINEAEEIIEGTTDDHNRKIKELNNNLHQMESDEMMGNTAWNSIFGSGNNKLKNPEKFWGLFNERNMIFDEIENLLIKDGKARESLAYNTNSKYDSEQEIKKSEGYIKSLKDMLEKLNKYYKPFEKRA
jgi:GTPase SAR1 family protein